MAQSEQSENKNQSKTLQDHLKNFLGALFIVGFTFLLLEGLVRFTDPWGLSFFNDLLVLGNDLFELDDTRGYLVKDGEHKFSYWTLTIENGTRYTPDTNPAADCTFVMLGDSVTMGHGVNDDEVWVNQLAREFPEIYFVNAGVSTYNSRNVLGTRRAFPDADAYLYLVIGNDVSATLNPDPEAFPDQNPTNLPYLTRYLSYMLFRARDVAPVDAVPSDDNPLRQRFVQDIEALVAEGDVWFASFDRFPIGYVMQDMGYDVRVYTYPPHLISRVDEHWNSQGNIEFANAIAPFIKEIQAERCPA